MKLKHPTTGSLWQPLRVVRRWRGPIATLGMFLLIASGFAIVRAGAGERFPWPASLSKMFGHRAKSALSSPAPLFAANLPVSQNFDGIGTSATATLPTDFKVDKNDTTVRSVGTFTAAGTATERVDGASVGSAAANGIYNFGSGTNDTGTDRAIGFISSGSATKSGNLYVELANNSGSNYSGLKISYDVEKYRNGSNADGYSIQMYYSTDGSTWTSAGANFLTSFTADADNSGFSPAPGATTAVTNQNLSQAVTNGSSFYLAWNYSVTSGTTTTNAQALGIDNIVISGTNTISGTLFNSAGSPITTGKTINLLQNGTSVGTTTTNVSGDYSFSGLTLTSGDRIAVFVDNASEKGAAVTLSGTTSISALNIFQNQLVVRSDNGSAITNANLSTAQGGVPDTDLTAIYTMSGSDLTTPAGVSLQIWSGSSYQPGGNITDGGDWTNNGTFTAGTFTVKLNSSAGNQGIGGNFDSNFYNLTIDNVPVNPTPATSNIVSLKFNPTTHVTNALNVTNGVFDQGQSGSDDFSLFTNTVTVGSGATWQNLGQGDLTLSGDVSNAGTIAFNANGTACGDAISNDDILIRSSDSGNPTPTQRTWAGTGTFSMTDVNVKDQKVPGVPNPPLFILVNSGTNAGNNTGWTFVDQCTSGTYTWIGGTLGANTDWTVGTNWNPTRGTTNNGDILIFDGTSTPAPVVTNIPTQTIAKLKFINGVSANFSNASVPAATARTLTIAGATSDAFVISSPSALTLDGSPTITLLLAAGSKGDIQAGSGATSGGQITLKGSAHRILAAADAITFADKTFFTTDTGFAGNPFGDGSTQGTPNSVAFRSGSVTNFHAGGDPFGATSPAVVTFDSGSTQNFFTNSAFSFDNRSYGHLTLDGDQAYSAGSATNALVCKNNLTIANGSSLSLSTAVGGDLILFGNLTDSNASGGITHNNGAVKFQGAGTIPSPLIQHVSTASTLGAVLISQTNGSVQMDANLAIEGELKFNSGNDLLVLNTKTLTLNGTVTGAGNLKGDAAASLNIGGSGGSVGTLRFLSGSQTLSVLTMNRTSSGSVTLANDLLVNDTLNLTDGVVDMGTFTLTINGAVSRTNGWIIGNEQLSRTCPSGPGCAMVFDVGTANGYSPVTESLTLSQPGTYTQTVKAVQGQHPSIHGASVNALQRYWTLNAPSGPGSATANITFNYSAGDVVGTPANYVFFKYNGAVWLPLAPNGTPTSTSATIHGVSSFSDWTLAEAGAVTPGTLTFVSAPYSTLEDNNLDHDVTITVSRSGGIDGAIDVSYETSDDTATIANNDYVAASGLLHWNDGETGNKTFLVRVKGDLTSEADETLNITLFNATGGATITGPTTTTLTIQNDDGAPEIAVEQPEGDDLTDGSVTAIDFGDEDIGVAGSPLTFTIKNSGSATLTITSVTSDNSDFSVNTSSMNSSVAPSGSTTFTVTFTPSSVGMRSGVIQINNNDSNENPFDINVEGNGNCPSEFVVNSTGDGSDATQGDGICATATGNGICTLRAAIEEGNALNDNCGPLLIKFNIPNDDPGHVYYKYDGSGSPNGTVSAANVTVTTAVNDAALPSAGPDMVDPDYPHSWWRIKPLIALPPINVALDIDGYFQSGASRNTKPLNEGNDAILRIEIDGSQLASGTDGLQFFENPGDYSIISGLVINHFHHDIYVEDEGGHIFSGNFLGVDVSGTLGDGSNGTGIFLDTGEFTLIGGDFPEDRNVISGHGGVGGAGIRINASLTTVEGNYIGTDRNGAVAIPNTDGVIITGGNENVIGCDVLDGDNVISGNDNIGVSISGGFTNVVQGNFIGTDKTGQVAIPNKSGVVLFNASLNFVGSGFGNVISGNTEDGVAIKGSSFANVIQTNLIGVAFDGTSPLGNGANGVEVYSGSTDNIIGEFADSGTLRAQLDARSQSLANKSSAGANKASAGANRESSSPRAARAQGAPRKQSLRDRASRRTLGETFDQRIAKARTKAAKNQSLLNKGSGAVNISPEVCGCPSGANIIANNGEDGVKVSSNNDLYNRISQNSIYSNLGLGINLVDHDPVTEGPSTVTPNDDGDSDGDIGPNGLQNFPVILSASAATGIIQFSLDTGDYGPYTIEFFSNASGCDIPSGYGEGQNYLGSYQVAGSGTYDSDPLSFNVGDIITATATDIYGNTSEFSLCFSVAPPATPDVSVTVAPSSVAEDGAGNLVYTFTRTTTTGSLTVNFAVSGTAAFGTDYTQSGAASFSSSGGTVTFAAGESTVNVTIDPTPDTVPEADEEVTLRVTAGSGYNIANPDIAFGTIQDDDCPSSLLVNSNGDSPDTNAGDGVCDSDSITSGDQCTLRAAIQEVNALNACANTVTINFNIPGSGVHTITPLSPLPSIQRPVTINGYSQPGGAMENTHIADNNAVLLIELTGSSAGAGVDGLVLEGGTSIKGLVINRFGGVAIKLTGFGNQVFGNFIGTDATGMLASDGNGPFGNDVGVLILDGAVNQIGSTLAEERNIISGNLYDGVQITGMSAFLNFVQGNFIGVKKDGVSALGNGGVGIEIYEGGVSTLIGGETNPPPGPGTAAPGGNIIAFNGDEGVLITASPDVGNQIMQNSIYSNGALGINLVKPASPGPVDPANGVTANDAGDGDDGPNNLQNFPIIESVDVSTQTISGTLNSVPNRSFLIEFFANPACDPSGHGEGKKFIASITTGVTDSVTGDVAFTFTAPALSFGAGDVITATATDGLGNTSEFSPCSVVLAVSKSAPSPALFVGQNSTYTITVTNSGTAAAVSATVTEAISGDLNLISASGTNWSCTPGSGSGPLTTSCTFSGSLAAAGASTIDIVVSPKAGTGGNNVTNKYSIDPTGGTNPPDPTTCTAANAPDAGCGNPVGPSTIGSAPASADLGITKTDSPDPAVVDNNLTYAIAVHNYGPDTAANVVVTDVLPANVAFVSATSSQGSCAGTTTITCNLGALSNGADATVQIVVTPLTAAIGTDLVNTASASSDANEPGSDPHSNTATATTHINACPTSFTVNHAGDTHDFNPGDGVCSDLNQNCTLRAAIEEANALISCAGTIDINFAFASETIIVLPQGQLSVEHKVNIIGPTTYSLTIDGNGTHRAFRIGSDNTVSISNLTITNCNESSGDGGGGVLNTGTLTLNGVTVNGNTAVKGGGITSTTNNSLTLINTTISGNTSSGNGGGLYNDTGQATLTNVTIAYNTANSGLGSESGGGIFVASGDVLLHNTIVADNLKALSLSTTTPDDISGNVNLASSYNVVGTGAGGLTNGGPNNNQIGVASALLKILQNNGGPTQTHALVYNSPAVDAGDGCVTDLTCSINNPPFAITKDQRGQDRPRDGDNNGASAVDIGAYERQVTETRDVPFGFNSSVDVVDAIITFPCVLPCGGERANPEGAQRDSAIAPAVSSPTASLTSIDPTPLNILSRPPNLVIGNSSSPPLPAFEVSTTASYQPPATVCFYLPSITNATFFAGLKILHREAGPNSTYGDSDDVLVDRTRATNPTDFANKLVCSEVSSFSAFAIAKTVTPTAANGTVSGQILDTNGQPVEGAAVRLSGSQNRLTVTDAQGNYHFDEVETNGLYVVTPSRANFTFSPAQRSFSQLGSNTEAIFTGAANGGTLNPLEATEYFVRQQYVDFLGREPDEAGFNFWVRNIDSCGVNDFGCREVKRIDTSAAFFLSIEFQQTGYLVYRIYQAAFGDMPGAPVPLKLSEFKPDTLQISNRVVVLQDGWQQRLESNKKAFMEEFVQRRRFVDAYPVRMSPNEFVDKLFANAGVPSTDSDYAAAIEEFGRTADTSDLAARARALRRIAENSFLARRRFNQAFVLMEYFGYLNRDPNSGQDTDFSGYNFWLDKLNHFDGNFREAEMVKAFLSSIEYRGRFPR